MDADADADADMEPAGGDEEVEDEADDNTPYCTCQTPSYGDVSSGHYFNCSPRANILASDDWMRQSFVSVRMGEYL